MTSDQIIAIGQAIGYAVGIPVAIYWFGRVFVEVLKDQPTVPLTYDYSKILDRIGKFPTYKGK